MALGVNAGKQLNVFLFETLLIVPGIGGAGGGARAISLALHPMFVVPSSITRTLASRGVVQRNMSGSLRILGGLDLERYSFSGTFGAQARGIGTVGGDGERRRRRFENEVVRLSNAVTNQDVEDAIAFFGTDFEATSGLNEAVPLVNKLAGFDISQGHFAVNLYDFWNRRHRQVHLARFQQTRAAAAGAAGGLVQYQLEVVEVGPLVSAAGSPTQLINLLEVTATANELLRLIDDNTLDDAVETAAQIIAIPLNFSALAPVARGAAATIRLLGPGGGLTQQRAANAAAATLQEATLNLAPYFRTVTNAIAEIQSAVDSLSADAPQQMRGSVGWVPFETSAYSDVEPWLANFETQVDLLDTADSLRFQKVLGCFYGLSREDYQAYIEAGGQLGGPTPDVTTLVQYTVTTTDTPASLTARFRTSWAAILDANSMTPDEAMYPGTVLVVPQRRARGPLGTNGLEVFGGRVGDAVFGSDVDFYLSSQGNGDLAIVTGRDCLAQGLTMIGEQVGSDLLGATSLVPDIVQGEFTAQRVRQAILTDRRVARVASVTATSVAGLGQRVEIDCVTINGTPLSAEVG